MRSPLPLALAIAALPVFPRAQDVYPLPASAVIDPATEDTRPFLTPARCTQTKVVDRVTLLGQGLSPTLNRWDMVAMSPDSRYVFVPCENLPGGGGVFRYDTQTGDHVEIFTGNNTGWINRNPDPATFDHTTDETNANDPCTWTPHGTIIFGEEWVGGRFFELMNPLDPTGPWDVRWRSIIPAVRHEGMRFDDAGNLYFVDEHFSGCIYKFVPTVVGDLSAGQTFCLSVDSYASHPHAVPTEDFDSIANRQTTRSGPATWEAITGPNGEQITPNDPYQHTVANGGRKAADDVFGTPFGRPEDIAVGTLFNGNQVLYVALTEENRVLSIELASTTTAIVRDFVNYDTINLASGTDVNPTQSDPFTPAIPTGNPPTFDSPDNVAVDAFGAVYIVEDHAPGDVWKAIDADGDGIAEHIGLFLSLSVPGAEPTGLLFDPNDPHRCILNVQHPASANDALWSIDTRPYPGNDEGLDLTTATNGGDLLTGPGEFVRCVVGGDTLHIEIDSDDATLIGTSYSLYASPFLTVFGSPRAAPLWLNGFALAIGFGTVGGNDDTYVLPVPAGLNGISVIAQAFTHRPGFGWVLSDGVEIQLK